MSDKGQFLGCDPVATAIHEVGHAIVQLAFNLGPNSVTINECSAGWCGQSQIFANIDRNKCKTEIELAQLAGPVSQLNYRPASLKEYENLLQGGILVRANELAARQYEILERLMWLHDLQLTTAIISRAKAVCMLPRIYKGIGWESGVYLFRFEEALTTFFMHTCVRNFVEEMSERLAIDHKLDPEIFCQRAKREISPEAFAILSTVILP